jgi:hypothetical protein
VGSDINTGMRSWLMLCVSSFGSVVGSIGLQAKSDGIRLFYRSRRNDDEWQDVDEIIPTVRTPTRFGGRRQWFCCLKCARRCRILYGGSRFRCRRCHRLSYSSQAETRAYRATRAMFKIVRRLDPEEDCNDLPPKPKGTHWRTYNRLVDRHDKFDQQWSWEAMRRFGMWL